jgi:hypothetical protein
MTAKSDAAAIAMTPNALKLSFGEGASVGQLQANLVLKLQEARTLVAQIIALTPGGDSQLSALNAILAELA